VEWFRTEIRAVRGTRHVGLREIDELAAFSGPNTTTSSVSAPGLLRYQTGIIASWV
jgi:hypothetical protein